MIPEDGKSYQKTGGESEKLLSDSPSVFFSGWKKTGKQKKHFFLSFSTFSPLTFQRLVSSFLPGYFDPFSFLSSSLFFHLPNFLSAFRIRKAEEETEKAFPRGKPEGKKHAALTPPPVEVQSDDCAESLQERKNVFF